ncbi:MAG: DUF459 domain-containing protein [Rhizobiales bacterium]|nr:DUF459 domain-containing protein [Hyphomicrobiales bacterium]
MLSRWVTEIFQRNALSWNAVFACLLVAAFMFVSPPVRALENGAQASNTSSYIPAVPDQGKYRLVVIGDSLGNGVWRGLNEAFRGETNIRIERRSRVSTGLVRDDYYDWPKELEQILRHEEPIQIAVVLFGTNDKQAIRAGNGHFVVGSPEWMQEYESRVDQVMAQLSRHGAAIYWVGLPIMRSQSFSVHAARINQIVRESAARFNVKFVETWEEFADDQGHYDAYGPDVFGRTRRLRMDDGIHFTGPGDRRLAHIVERLLRADMQNIAGDSVLNNGMDTLPPIPEWRPDRENTASLPYDRYAALSRAN